MKRFVQCFVRITAWPVQWFCFRTKIYYEDKKVQSRKIKGKAIIVSNHTSVYDFAVMLFVFPFRFLRYLMAELLFRKKILGKFLKLMGGIKVDRDNYDFSFISKSIDVLDKRGVIGVFPEGRLPTKGESRPLEFKPSAAYIAYLTDAPIIPVYTNGSYFKRKRARVIIGKPIYVCDVIDEKYSEKDNIERINQLIRQKVIELGNELERRTNKKETKK